MLELVDVGPRPVEAYRGIVPDHLLDSLQSSAEKLRGARVLHINATSYGGGVSELLRSEIPLLNALGIVAHWRIISGDAEFFRVTKALHNGLQGAPLTLSPTDRDRYLETTGANARTFTEDYDFVFVHDPQPAPLLALRGKGRARWIWRSHIDTSHANPEIWAFLRPFLVDYDAAIFTLPEFVPADLPTRTVEIIPPAIDPLSPKNMALPKDVAVRVLQWLGIRTDHPLVTQVSRFDPWKDPVGVIQAFREARRHVPDLQLALVGSLALDDPEGWDVYRRLQREEASDSAIHLFTNVIGVGNIEVNAFQRLSRVVIQKSLREGFGLVVSEALWKGTPVIAGRAGGIPLQMADGAGGYLVDSTAECGEALVKLLGDPVLAASLGERGRARVAEHFLLPRLLLNHLALMNALAERAPIAPRRPLSSEVDPVCGMALGPAEPLFVFYRGERIRFCSERCRALFQESPAHYVAAPGGLMPGSPAGTDS